MCSDRLNLEKAAKVSILPPAQPSAATSIPTVFLWDPIYQYISVTYFSFPQWHSTVGVSNEHLKRGLFCWHLAFSPGLPPAHTLCIKPVKCFSSLGLLPEVVSSVLAYFLFLTYFVGCSEEREPNYNQLNCLIVLSTFCWMILRNQSFLELQVKWTRANLSSSC